MNALHSHWRTAALIIACSGPAHAEPEAVVDGAAIYDQHCARCHNAGLSSLLYRAPRIATTYWPARLAAVGRDQLVTNTLSGVGRMPAQGGAGGLSEAKVRAAVGHLLDTPPASE